MAIQMFDREAPRFEQETMTPEQRYVSYVNSFAMLGPTDGVKVPSRYHSVHWPRAPKPQQPTHENEDNSHGPDGQDQSLLTPIVFSTSLLPFKISPENYHLSFDPDKDEYTIVPFERSEEFKMKVGQAGQIEPEQKGGVPLEAAGLLAGFEMEESVKDVDMDDAHANDDEESKPAEQPEPAEETPATVEASTEEPKEHVIEEKGPSISAEEVKDVDVPMEVAAQ
jgi:C-terminal domain of Sin3a protein